MSTTINRETADELANIDKAMAAIRTSLRKIQALRPDPRVQEQLPLLLEAFSMTVLPDLAVARRASKDTGEVLNWRTSWRLTPKGKLFTQDWPNMTKREARMGWYRVHGRQSQCLGGWDIKEL